MSTTKGVRQTVNGGKTMRTNKWVSIAVACGLLGTTAIVAHGANGTWNGTTGGDAGPNNSGQQWSDTNKWVSGIVAGTLGTTDSPDTLAMPNQGHYTITLDNDYNISNATHNVGAHRHAIVQTNGVSVLHLSKGGAVLATGNGSVRYCTPIRLEGGSGGSYSFLHGGTLTIYGTVSGTATTGGNYDLILGGGGGSVDTLTIAPASYIGNLADGSGGGTLSVIKTGTGIWTLNNANTYSGATTIRNGRLKFSQTGSFGPGSSAIQLGDSGTAASDTVDLELANNITFTRNISVNNYNPSGAAVISCRNNLGTAGFGGTITLNRTVTIYDTGSGFLTFSGKITGTGGIIKDGPDKATLSSAVNDYQGGTTIIAGLLIASGTGSLGTGPVAVNGGVLRANDGVGLSTSVNLPLNGGVWESGANITRTLGTGANQVQLAGYSGFSANGANINVNLNTGATLVWGSTAGFSPTNLVLNETTAGNQLTFQNALNLNGADRTFSVNANTAVFSGNIGNSSGTAGIVKNGAGTLTLTGTNTFNGGLTVNAGGLTVDYAGKNTGVVLVPVGAPLVLNGATFTLNGSASNSQTTVQTVAGLTLAANPNTVTAVANNSRPVVLNLGAITRNAGGGTVNFTLPSGTQDASNGITTPTGGSSGKLGPWAMVGGNEWAAKSGNNIVAWSAAGGTYVDVTRLSSGSKTIASNPNNDVRIIEGTGSVGDITPAASGITDIATILHTATGGSTTNNPGTADILRLGVDGGITLVSGARDLTIGTASGDGILTAGGAANTAGKITVVNNAGTTYRLYINSAITDNGNGVVSVETAGSGYVNLAGTNTFSGGLTIASGGVYASGPSTNVLGTGRLTLNGGVFSLHTSDGQNPANQYVGSIAGNSGSAAIRAGNRTLTFGSDNSTSTYMGGWDGGTFTKVGTGTTTVFSASSIAPSTIQGLNVDQGTVKLGAAKDFPSTGAINVKGTLDLNGYSATVYLNGLFTGGTILTGGGTFTNLNTQQYWQNPSGLAATASFTGNLYMPANPSFKGDANATLDINGVLSGGAGTITADGNMQATAVIRLSGSANNTFSGTWSVSKGQTELNKSGGAIAISTNVTMTGGTIRWLADEQVADGATVNMSSGARLNMNGFTDWVRTLVLGGTTQTEGTWGGTGSGAKYTNTTYFIAGTGMLRVGVKPVAGTVLILE